MLPFGADYRQWTLSFPRWLRIRLLRDKALVSEVLLGFVRAVSAYHRRRARERGVACGETGAVTAIQLGGSFVNANLHFHTLVPEAVWPEQPDGSVSFHPLPPPTDEDVELLAVRIVRRVARLLARRDADAAIDDELDVLDHAQAEAVQLPMTFSEPRPQTSPSSRRRCALVDGFSLHANTSVDAADRAALERLCRYILRLMGPGEYALQRATDPDQGHFGLAVEDYTHSTAPNRRFPDLVTQRLLKATALEQAAAYSDDELIDIAAHCTDRENAARKVERTIRKIAAAVLLTPRIGETFEAIVTGVADKGTFARLLRPPAEGRVVSGERGLDVGDAILVRLVDTEPMRGFIDFAALERR